jgi:pimeloyl-ACP methyl ester carboxylesterase
MNQLCVESDLSLQVRGKTIVARRWGSPTGKPVLALHGWLDNANSFELLAPLLHNVDLIALDLAGHGQSSHRSGDATYNIWDDIPEIIMIADQLGWETFTLLGHSRGAIISMLVAGTFPERISQAVMLDGFWPEPVVPADGPKQLAQAILDDAKPRRRPTENKNIGIFILARKNGTFSLSRDAAKRLTCRGLRQVPGGYVWSTDPRLRNSSAVKLTQSHIDAFLDAITAKVLVVLADKGIPLMSDKDAAAIRARGNFKVEVLPGSHHFHLEQSTVVKVAETINSFINS